MSATLDRPDRHFAVGFDRKPEDTAPWAWLVVWTALALAIRLFALDRQALWTDECESIKLLVKPGIDPWYVITHNFHGPLHKVLIWGWCSVFGTGDIASRSLSAVLGTAAVPVVFLAARRWVGHTIAIWAAFLLAINPFHVYYSQEVRGYVLLMAVSPLTMWAFLNDVRRRTRVSGALFVVAALAAALSNFGGLFVVATCAAFGLLAAWRRGYRLTRLFTLLLLVFVALVPYFIEYGSTVDADAIVGLGEVSDQKRLRGSHTFSILAPLHQFFAYSVGLTLGPAINDMHRSLNFETFRPHLFGIIATAVVFGAVALLGLIRSRGRSERAGFVLLWLLLPIVATAVLAFLNIKVYNIRYPAGGFIAWILLLALGVGSVRSQTVRLGIGTMVAALSVWSIVNHHTVTAYMRPDARAAAELVAEHAEPGDRILLYSIAEPFIHYYNWKLGGELRVNILHGGYLWNRDRFQTYIDDFTACGDGRIWLIRWRGWYIDPRDKCKATLDANLEHLGSWRFTNLPVDLYGCGDGSIELAF